jgi:hypothetical protein
MILVTASAFDAPAAIIQTKVEVLIIERVNVARIDGGFGESVIAIIFSNRSI